MFRLIFGATCVFALCTSAFADITHWVWEPYQPAVSPGSDPLHPDFNDGSYWTVDLMVTISGDDHWTSTQVDATIDSGMFFQHDVGSACPPLAAFVAIYPAVEYDCFYLSTEADGANQPPFKCPSFAEEGHQDQHVWAVWFDVPPNGGDGDFVIARFTVHLSGEQATLYLEGASTTFEYGGELFPFAFEVPLAGGGSHDPVEDCNNNGIEDSQDIANGTSEDYNENGMPDECEPGSDQDCNENGVPDLHDIHDGTSQDCQLNGIPDECDIADGTSGDTNADGVPDECEFVSYDSVYRAIEIYGLAACEGEERFHQRRSSHYAGPWEAEFWRTVYVGCFEQSSVANAKATQSSDIGAGLITAVGYVHANTDPYYGYAEASASSLLQSSFDLLREARVELFGELHHDLYCAASVQLRRDGDSVYSASGSGPYSFEGLLGPGYYTLDVRASARSGGGFGSGRFEAEYEMTFRLSPYCAGDITGDAATDQADLGILLALWGNCEGDGDYDPAADLDGDGCINHADLGILLADWGCGT